MARKNKSKSQRDTPDIASPRLLGTLSPKPASFLNEFEDRRTYNPERDNRPALSFTGTQHRLVAADRKTQSARQGARYGARVRSQTKAIIGFHSPAGVLVCVRRKRRREVLHAKKKLRGRGGSRRRNWTSSITC